MLTNTKNAHVVVENAVETVGADGTTSSSVQVRPNLETSALAKMLRFSSAHDELLISQLAAADADVKKYLVEHLGQQALGKVPPAEMELIDALRAKSGAKLPRDGEPGGPTANFTKPFVSSATSEKPTGTEDPSRLDTKLDAFEGGRFSMMVAMSQWLLNNTFEVLHSMEPSRQLLNLTDDLTGSSFNDAELLPPRIAIDVANETTTSRGRAIYYMRFGQTGTCTLAYPNTTTVTLPVKDWVFAFSVDISLIDIDPQSDEYEQVVQKFGKPGDYRISRLLANLETADIISPILSACTFGDVEDEVLAAFFSFQLLMINWINMAKQQGQGILGYSMSVSELQGTAEEGTFPPTSQQLQAYAHLAPGQEYPVTSVDSDGENNMIILLNMTQNLPFPPVSKLPYTGNWCTPIDRATIAIGNQLFFEQFIIPLLMEFNAASFKQPLEPLIDHSGLTWYLTFRRTRGEHGNEFYDSWVKTNNQWPEPHWVWEKSNKSRNSKQVNGLGRFTMEHTIDVKNTIGIEPGSNIIRISHELIDHRKSSWRWVRTQDGSGTVRRFVTYHVYLDSILEGKLALTMLGDEEIETKVTRIDDFWFDRDYVSDQAKILANELKTSKALPVAVERLSNRLGTQDTFVLPGGGYFFMKNPIFNKDADLLARLEFKGV